MFKPIPITLAVDYIGRVFVDLTVASFSYLASLSCCTSQFDDQYPFFPRSLAVLLCFRVIFYLSRPHCQRVLFSLPLPGLPCRTAKRVTHSVHPTCLPRHVYSVIATAVPAGSASLSLSFQLLNYASAQLPRAPAFFVPALLVYLFVL